MKRTSLRLLCALAFLAFGFAARADVGAELQGKLVALRGKSAQSIALPELPKARYIALYYSAGWCAPCHKFTPELVKFYEEMKAKYPDFEIVFMSRDESPNDMENYMAEMKMPWPALRYSMLQSSPNLTKYCGTGIPCLVLLNQKGEVLSDSFKGHQYLGPQKVMDDLKNLLASNPAPASATSASTPASSVNSPSGTNWADAFKKKSP